MAERKNCLLYIWSDRVDQNYYGPLSVPSEGFDHTFLSTIMSEGVSLKCDGSPWSFKTPSFQNHLLVTYKNIDTIDLFFVKDDVPLTGEIVKSRLIPFFNKKGIPVDSLTLEFNESGTI